jgi:phage tail-like protein
VPRTGDRNDPYIGFKFKMEIDDVGVAGFTSCTGLDVEIEVESYEEGGENGFVHKLPGRRRQSDVELKRGIAGRELWSWLEEVKLGRAGRRSLTILVGNPGAERIEFVLEGVIPIRWRGPELASDNSAVAVETLTLAHQGLEWKA